MEAKCRGRRGSEAHSEKVLSCETWPSAGYNVGVTLVHVTTDFHDRAGNWTFSRRMPVPARQSVEVSI